MHEFLTVTADRSEVGEVILESIPHQKQLKPLNSASSNKLTHSTIIMRAKNNNVGEEEIEVIEEKIYLGQIVSFKNKGGKEIARRIKNSWANFSGQNTIYGGNFTAKNEK